MRPRAARPALLAVGLAGAACGLLAGCDMGQPELGPQATWLVQPTTDLVDVLGITQDWALAVGADGSLLSRWATGRVEVELPAGSGVRGVGGIRNVFYMAVGQTGAVWQDDGTDWRRSRVGVHDLLAAGGTAWDDIFVVGEQGAIGHFDGQAWSEMDGGTDQALRAVAGRGRDDVYVVGGHGTILHWDGATWSRELLSPDTDLLAVATTAEDVFVLSDRAILRRGDGAWEPVFQEPGGRLRDLAWSPGRSWLVAVGAGGLGLVWNPDLQQWEQVPAPTERDLRAASLAYEGTVWAVGTAGTWLTRDYYWGWQEILSGLASRFDRLCLVAPDRLLAGGRFEEAYEGVFWYGSGDGVLLTLPATPVPRPILECRTGPEAILLRDIWSPAPGRAVAVGEDGALKLEDGAWGPLTLWRPYSGADAVHGRSLDDFWALAAGQAHHFRAGAWSAEDLPDPADDLWVLPDGTLMVAGQGIWRLGGDGWMQESDATCLRLWGGSNGEMFAVGGRGLILHRRDGVWRAEDSGVTSPLFGVWARDPGPRAGAAVKEAWAVGRRAFLRYDGATWRPVEPPPGAENLDLLDVCAGPGGGVFVATAGGGVFSRFLYPLDD